MKKISNFLFISFFPGLWSLTPPVITSTQTAASWLYSLLWGRTLGSTSARPPTRLLRAALPSCFMSLVGLIVFHFKNSCARKTLFKSCFSSLCHDHWCVSFQRPPRCLSQQSSSVCWWVRLYLCPVMWPAIPTLNYTGSTSKMDKHW